MTFVWLYWIMLICSCGYAAAFGGWSGKSAGIIMILASALSLCVTPRNAEWTGPLYLVFWIDLAAAVALFWVAIRSVSYWPLWSASFQMTATIVHLARIASPSAAPKFYQAFQTVWSVPLILVMVIGISIDRRKPPERD